MCVCVYACERCLCDPFTHRLCVSVCVCVCLCVYVSSTWCAVNSVCVSVSLCLFASLSLSNSLSLFNYLCLSVFVCVHVRVRKCPSSFHLHPFPCTLHPIPLPHLIPPTREPLCVCNKRGTLRCVHRWLSRKLDPELHSCADIFFHTCQLWPLSPWLSPRHRLCQLGTLLFILSLSLSLLSFSLSPFLFSRLSFLSLSLALSTLLSLLYSLSLSLPYSLSLLYSLLFLYSTLSLSLSILLPPSLSLSL
jgi:hypothetical protein